MAAAGSRRTSPALVVLAAVVALACAVILPFVDRILNGSAEEPTFITWLGVPAAVAICASGALYALGVVRMHTSVAFFVLAAAYNSVFLFAKLGLAPLSLYIANQHAAFDSQILGGQWTYVFIALAMAIFYIAIFLVLAYWQRRQARKALGVRGGVRIPIWAIVLVAAAVLLGPGLASVFVGFVAFTYAVAVLSTEVGLLLLLALFLALVLAYQALGMLRRRAVAEGDLTLLAAFTPVGVAMIAAYHVLWMVVVLLLVSLFPLKVYDTK